MDGVAMFNQEVLFSSFSDVLDVSDEIMYL